MARTGQEVVPSNVVSLLCAFKNHSRYWNTKYREASFIEFSNLKQPNESYVFAAVGGVSVRRSCPKMEVDAFR